MTKVSIEELIKKNSARWKNVAPTHDYSKIARRLLSTKDRYQAVEAVTGVPWYVIAVIHERESAQNWNTQLAQGDPLRQVSRHIPKGRGPFDTWEDGAYDALVNCHPYASKWKDWTAGGTLTILELYNGLGYAQKNRPSSYVWAGTNQYKSGKYVADGVWDPNAIDSQPGCASLLISMKAKDPSIQFSDEKPVIKEEEKLTPPKFVSPTAAATGGIAATALSAWMFLKAHWIELTIATAVIMGITAVLVHEYNKRKAKKDAEKLVGEDQSSVPVA